MGFEDFFKSEASTCESCGQDIAKGMKHKKKSKVGNEMDPHKGKPSGSTHVGSSRGGYKAGDVDRDNAAKPRKPKSGIVKSLFPMSNESLVQYDNSTDARLSQNIQNQNSGLPNELFVPSMRNLAMEQAAQEE